jgi:hypothetical protein
MASNIPQDGRMTSFQSLPLALTGGELMWIVSPGNAANGVLYNVTTATLGAFFSAFPFLNTELITAGATIGSPYNVQKTDTRILFKKTIGSASYAVCPLAASMQFGQSVFFKDLKGDAHTNNITISFTSGELCDGLSDLVIKNAYGFIAITPVPGGGAWYQSL